ncbi:MAG: hypothetical protein ACHQUA_00180 [Microgenomates group bacterium]
MEIPTQAFEKRFEYTKADLKLIEIGLNLMSKSKDATHDLLHTSRTWTDLVKFKSDSMNDRIRVDYRAVTHALIHHDIYKAGLKRSTHGINLLTEELVEGYQSMKIFERHANQVDLDKKTKETAMAAIRDHGLIHLPRFLNESKLLFDLDELDFWNLHRFRTGLNFFNYDVGRQINTAMAYLDFRTKNGFYFEWSKQQFDERKKSFLQEFGPKK